MNLSKIRNWFKPKPVVNIRQVEELHVSAEEAAELMWNRGWFDAHWHVSPNVLFKDDTDYITGFEQGQKDLLGEGDSGRTNDSGTPDAG